MNGLQTDTSMCLYVYGYKSHSPTNEGPIITEQTSMIILYRYHDYVGPTFSLTASALLPLDDHGLSGKGE